MNCPDTQWRRSKHAERSLSIPKHKVRFSSCLTSLSLPYPLTYKSSLPGMVIGESAKSQDLYLNPCIKKQLTNIRAVGADEKFVLALLRIMTLKEALAYMGNDEIVEVTSSSVRLRKVMLDQVKRMRMKGGKK